MVKIPYKAVSVLPQQLDKLGMKFKIEQLTDKSVLMLILVSQIHR